MPKASRGKKARRDQGGDKGKGGRVRDGRDEAKDQGAAMDPDKRSRMGPGARIVGMLVNPGMTLDEVISRPRALPTAALLLVINVFLTAAILDKIHQHALWLVEHHPPPQIPAEELGQFAEQASVIASSGAIVGPLITWFMVALILRILGSGRGQVVTFGLLFNVAVFTMVPHMIGLYLESVVKFFADPFRLDFLHLSMSLAYLVPGAELSRAFPLLNAINPFTIWGLVLAAMGGARVLKLNFARVAVPFLGLWFLFALLQSFSYRGPGF